MKKLILLLSILASASSAFAQDSLYINRSDGTVVSYAIASVDSITFARKTSYIVATTNFKYQNYSCDINFTSMQHDSVYVINSEEEFANYFNCTNSPQIDFSTKTLLVAFGGSPNGISNISTELSVEKNTHSLMVDITLDMTAVAQSWRIVALTPKLPQNSVVKLDLRQHH